MSIGIDFERFGNDESYMESLSETTRTLSSVAARSRTAISDDPDLVDFGNMPATNTLVVYWSGASDAAELATIRDIAARAGVKVVVAQRKVSRAELSAASDQLKARVKDYRKQGYVLSAFGGFAADFDGIKVTVKTSGSAALNVAGFESALASDLAVPVAVTNGGTVPAAGRYDDSQPFNGGGFMVNGGGRCTSGFGVVKGSSVYRYISARHCSDGAPWHTEMSARAMGSAQVQGTGNSGAAVFSAQGSAVVFSGTNVGNPTSIRTVTQRDPALSTVGSAVCQQGANLGQRCGTIAQVAVLYYEVDTWIKTNYVTSPNDSIIAAQGDSGAPVISLHTQSRAWTVGILLGIQSPFNYGSACGARFAPSGLACSRNFYFNNVDYAMGGLPGYAIRYS